MNYEGLIIGACTFLVIGIFHPIVIKTEYHFGVKVWWVFLLLGLVALALSLVVHNTILSTLLGVLAFSSFWSIKELFEQRERVRKGWFPKKEEQRFGRYSFFFRWPNKKCIWSLCLPSKGSSALRMVVIALSPFGSFRLAHHSPHCGHGTSCHSGSCSVYLCSRCGTIGWESRDSL